MASNMSWKNILLITILAFSAMAITCPSGQKDDGTGQVCVGDNDPCA